MLALVDCLRVQNPRLRAVSPGPNLIPRDLQIEQPRLPTLPGTGSPLQDMVDCAIRVRMLLIDVDMENRVPSGAGHRGPHAHRGYLTWGTYYDSVRTRLQRIMGQQGRDVTTLRRAVQQKPMRIRTVSVVDLGNHDLPCLGRDRRCCSLVLIWFKGIHDVSRRNDMKPVLIVDLLRVSEDRSITCNESECLMMDRSRQVNVVRRVVDGPLSWSRRVRCEQLPQFLDECMQPERVRSWQAWQFFCKGKNRVSTRILSIPLQFANKFLSHEETNAMTQCRSKYLSALTGVTIPEYVEEDV